MMEDVGRARDVDHRYVVVDEDSDPAWTASARVHGVETVPGDPRFPWHDLWVGWHVRGVAEPAIGGTVDAMNDTMHAVVLDRIGGPLSPRQVAVPAPAPGQVLVRVAVSAVNPLDIKIREGRADHARVTAPAILGIDMAGVVAAAGDGVTRFRVGDEVYGMSGGVGDRAGSLAEYQAVDASLLARKPSTLSMAEAAALPLAAVTAWEGLVDRATLRHGMAVLVHGGGGSVGQAAVQIARARGARVFATGTGASLDVIRASRAVPIDYRTTSVEEYVATFTGGAGFDVVLDTVGGTTLDASFIAVKRYTGHVVSILGWGPHNLAPLSLRGATYSGVFALLPLLTGEGFARHGEILAQVASLAEAGHLRPRVHPRVFDVETVAEAHRLVKAGGAQGKVVVRVAPAAMSRRSARRSDRGLPGPGPREVQPRYPRGECR